MKAALALLILVSSLTVNAAKPLWVTEKHARYQLHYTTANKAQKAEYLRFLDQGVINAEAFFHGSYSKRFDVFIQPDRPTFDKAYQGIYHKPGFRSQCWLVAIGDGYRISIIAPRTWDKEPCASRYTNYADRVKTQKLITHELIHVYHGQLNADRNLSENNGNDWFVEGLAFYASGQLGTQEQASVRKAMSAKQVPATLDALSAFPDVNLRYALWGSLVRYIDLHYGRAKLKSMLVYGRREQLLAVLKTDEPHLISDWKQATLSHK